ncbi:MAG: peptidase M16-like protein, partial [Acidobacteriaceae bacterium]|nr:peptidase M16-like protein [Acidobacteriaceae bacterium]
MKRFSSHNFVRIILSGLFLILGIATGAAQVTTPTDWQQIPIPQLKPFHPPEPKRIEFPNGMVVFLQEDHELPLIDGMARIHGGSR